MIDQLTINRLEATPIEGVAEHLGLQVNRHKCLCPFHEDSHPSLTFNTYKNRYRCYVCDAHGGVIDLVRNVKGVGFREACNWIDSGIADAIREQRTMFKQKPKKIYPPDVAWLSTLVQPRVLNEDARRFLFEERKLDERVIAWCGLSSIDYPAPCWRYGRPFYDAPSLLIPYYDMDGHLMSVQSRYLGTEDRPRFKFPRGSNCHVYGMQILRYLRPGEELWITEGCSDCWAMLSAGKKAIAIPSATLLKDKDIEPLRGLNLHMAPDQDKPGERLFLELRERLPQLVHHQLPSGYKDFGQYYSSAFSNRVAMVDTATLNRRATDASAFPTTAKPCRGPQVSVIGYGMATRRDGILCRLSRGPRTERRQGMPSLQEANSQRPTANSQQPTVNNQQPMLNVKC